MSARSHAAPWYRDRYPYGDVVRRMFAEVVREVRADAGAGADRGARAADARTRRRPYTNLLPSTSNARTIRAYTTMRNSVIIPGVTIARDEPGNYERKQLLSTSRLVRWSHGRRFEAAYLYARNIGGDSLLDYGCGDGTFLKRARHVVKHVVGADANPVDASILPTSELGDDHTGRYDLVFCMEVLEHCISTDAEAVIRDLRRLVSTGGSVVVSVPIETGPTLLGKQAARRLLGMRQVGQYEWTARYTWPDLVKMTFAGQSTAIDRLSTEHGTGSYHHHHGFNWKALRERLRQDFDIVETNFSPLSWTRGLLSSQVWFVCRPKMTKDPAKPKPSGVESRNECDAMLWRG